MSGTELPDFQQALQRAGGVLDVAEMAEVHGVICGLICRQPALTLDACLYQLAALQLVVDPGPDMQSLVEQLMNTAVRQLDDEELSFTLWLPDDDEALEERTIALANWCSGFLAGLACSGEFGELSEEVGEALEDLQQIARAELSTDDDQSEEDENALMEISEYVRIVTLMIREELRGPSEQDPIH